MNLTKILLLGVVGILIIAGIIYGANIYQLSAEQNRLKEEYAELNRINYGLFNIQLWKEKAFTLFRDQAQEFTISPGVYTDVETQITAYLHQLYDEYIGSGILVNQMIADAEKSGTINTFFANVLKENVGNQIKDLNLKARIPEMSQSLTGELKANEPKLKQYIAEGLESMLFEPEDQKYIDPRTAFFTGLGFSDINEYNSITQEKIQALDQELNQKLKLEYGILILGILICLFTMKYIGARTAITLITLISIVFLILGVTMPMIDIDARLNNFRMMLLSQEISFDEQFLYFQSKSILDVTKTLLEGRGIDLKIVGILVLMFSVVVPLIKLIISALFMYLPKIRNQKIARGIIFYLGKWSMADVFVVAMFMAYIGFYGIINSQLQEIKGNETGYAVETLNYSQLSPGALFFTTYCVLSIITGILIHRQFLNDNQSKIV